MEYRKRGIAESLVKVCEDELERRFEACAGQHLEKSSLRIMPKVVSEINGSYWFEERVSRCWRILVSSYVGPRKSLHSLGKHHLHGRSSINLIYILKTSSTRTVSPLLIDSFAAIPVAIDQAPSICEAARLSGSSRRVPNRSSSS